MPLIIEEGQFGY